MVLPVISDRLSILQVITQKRFSGAERVCLSLCIELQKRGHRVLLICKPDGGMPEEARAQGVTVETPAIAGKCNLCASSRIARLAKNFGADLIHTHLSTASLWGGLAGICAGIPTLGHVHALNSRFCFRFNTMLATCSVGVKRHIIEQGAPAERVRVVYNGIPTGRLDGVLSTAEARGMLGLAPDQPVVACVAHLSPKKGQHILLQAVALLKPRFPPLVCLLVGEGEQDSDLRARAAQLGIAEHVRLLGFRRDAMSVMNAADVVVLPSIAKEGLGLVLVEAALLQKPTVGSNAPGIDEVISDGTTGLLAVPGNAVDLAEKLARLFDDAAMRQRFGTAGREKALRLFSQEAMIDGFEAVYRELLQR